MAVRGLGCPGDFHDFRVWAGIMGEKESHYVATQGAGDPAKLLDQLLVGGDAAAALDERGLLDALKKALAERALNAEMDHHLGSEAEADNSRNGYGRKTVMTDTGKLEIEVPRDRQGSFDPQLIGVWAATAPSVLDRSISAALSVPVAKSGVAD